MTLGLAALIALPASAELVIGKVVDANGVGVAGVNLDVENDGGGGDPDVFGDGTDANGNFAMTVDTPGVFRITFTPPPPPVSSSLVFEIENVPVVGTVNLGNVQLPAGVAVTGRAVNTSGVPVPGVDLDVIDASGVKLDSPADTTNAFGVFSIAVPVGPSELRFDTSTVAAPTYAGVAFDLDLGADLDLGDVTLPPGFRINGTLTGPGGGGLSGIDFDVENSLTNADQYVPKDNSQAGGAFSLVVPAGTWDLFACPPVSQQLVAGQVLAVAVSGTTSVGTLALQSGVVLSGQVTAVGGAPVKGVDIDVDVSGSGVSVPLCSDNTNPSGNYAVVVPAGTYDLSFSPSYATPHGSHVEFGVAVGGATVVDATVPDCPFGSTYGVGLAGTAGFVPALSSTGGSPRLGNDSWRYQVDSGLGGTAGLIWLSVAPSSLPIFGGTLLVDVVQPNQFFFAFLGGPVGAPGAGAGAVPLPIPIGPAFVGLTLYAQALLSDAAAPQGLSLSNGFAVTFCD